MINKQSLFPTITPIQDIISKGIVENSPVAEDFHMALLDHLSLSGIASYYYDADPTLQDSQNSLTIFVRSNYDGRFFHNNTSVHLFDDPDTEEIFSLFFHVCDLHSIQYHAVPARPKPTLQKMKQLQKKKPYSPAHTVSIEPFEPLVLWHIYGLHSAEVKLGLRNLFDLNVRVFYRWDHYEKKPSLGIFTNTDAEFEAFLAHYNRGEIIKACRRVLMPYDHWSVLTSDWFLVTFDSWERLSYEEQFGMLRG